jgi:diacylglycerol kinase
MRMMRNFLKAFVYAFTGLITFFRHERNGKIQLLAAVLAVILGGVLHVSRQEWMWLIACIATVLSFEMMNTAVEKICNMVQPGFHPAVKLIKDVAAAAVLLVAFFSALIGALIFLPKIIHSL